MKLLYLRSSNQKFNSIEFKEGLNIIIGSQKTKDSNASFNGVGKSMSLRLIHYILGSTFGKQKKLKEYLGTYGNFELAFEHLGKKYIIDKDFSNNDFYINNIKFNTKNYSKKLNEIFIQGSNLISFRQLFNCFARRHDPKENYYSDALKQQARPETDYRQKFVNLFLLGVDAYLIEKNYDLKEQLTNIKLMAKTIKFYEEKLGRSNEKDLQDKIEKLELNLKNFMVADDYKNLKEEADRLTIFLNEYRNKLYTLNKHLRLKNNIYENSEIQEIDIEKIKEIYKEAEFFFNEKVIKEVDEVQKFHNNLISNRKKRVELEIEEINIDIKEVKLIISEIGEKRDALLKNLCSTGALEERDGLKDILKIYEQEKKEMEKYKNILEKLKSDKLKLEEELLELRKKRNKYIKGKENDLLEIESMFKKIVYRFYNNTNATLKISENDSAKYCFDIDVSIPKQDSQGVGEVKIFSYDILLYLLNPNILNFLAHDGCLFSEMDERQGATIFKIIIELIKSNNLQYYLNINEVTLNKILKENILTEEEVGYIVGSKRLELFDNSPENWLFGESFD